MHVLILTGIHGNLPAFEAVLRDSKAQWDFVWCLGDVIGYGTEPNECVELLQTLPHIGLCGLYECAVTGECNPLLEFDDKGDRFAAEWSQKQLKLKYVEFLKEFPKIFVVEDFTLVHGSPREPLRDYIGSQLIAALSFPHFKTKYCFSGLPAVPTIYELINERLDTVVHSPQYGEHHQLDNQRKIIIPGYVGISSAGTPQYAHYGLLDTETYTFQHRQCLYDNTRTLTRLRTENFPEQVIRRWEKGYY